MSALHHKIKMRDRGKVNLRTLSRLDLFALALAEVASDVLDVRLAGLVVEDLLPEGTGLLKVDCLEGEGNRQYENFPSTLIATYARWSRRDP